MCVPISRWHLLSVGDRPDGVLQVTSLLLLFLITDMPRTWFYTRLLLLKPRLTSLEFMTPLLIPTSELPVRHGNVIRVTLAIMSAHFRL